MTLTNFTPVSALLGGLLIGASASIVLLACGRIAGISGIFGGVLGPPAETNAKHEEDAWRLYFLGGLMGGGVVLAFFFPSALGAPIMGSLGRAALAAVLVGVGVELGAGCTSGHGVCGIGRFSPRSIVATITFIAAGMLMVFALRALGIVT